MNATDPQTVVITVDGDAANLSSNLAQLVGEHNGDVSFEDVDGSGDAHRGLADFATTIATLSPLTSAIGVLLRAVFGFATSRGSRSIEITGADGTTLKVPTSVSPAELAAYVEQFQQINGVRIHVDPPEVRP